MFPWTSPTRTARPCETSSFLSRRLAPHIVMTISTEAVTPTVMNEPRERETTKYASDVLTSATSADMPRTPATLANCAIGRTVVWLYPSSSQGKPDQKYVRPSSVVTHTAGASRIARRPYFAPSHPRHNVNSPGNSERYATSSAATTTPTGALNPPNCETTVPVQYTVPPKYARPATNPSRNERPRRNAGQLRWISNRGTMRGASATHARSGWPYRGKLRARRIPEISARIRAASPGRIRAGAATLRRPHHQAAEK